jgi:PPP family 3-phenylpropionic acid transporter
MAVFLTCAFLMLLSHGAYYAFFSIHLANLGFQSTFIGLCWAVAVCAEILTMIFSERIFKRFTYETVLIASFAVATLRWFSLWKLQSAGAIVVVQITHAFSYGAFHMASILYIDLLAPAETKTLGQAVNNAVTYGLGLMVGFFLSGALYARIGTNGLFALSGLMALAGGCILLVYVLAQMKTIGVDNP